MKTDLPQDVIPGTVLLVEDDPRDAELILAALEENRLANHVILVRDGEEALDYLHRRGTFHDRPRGNPIFVLLDNKMPKVSGLEVLKAMKADKLLKDIPVVALTASRLTPDLIAFQKHGVNSHLLKPIDFAELMKAVQQLDLSWTAVNQRQPVPSISS